MAMLPPENLIDAALQKHLRESFDKLAKEGRVYKFDPSKYHQAPEDGPPVGVAPMNIRTYYDPSTRKYYVEHQRVRPRSRHDYDWPPYPPETINCRSASHPDTEQGASEMTTNTKEMITLMQLQGGATIFKARYEDGAKEYAFKNAVGLDLAKGDVVVVETRDTFGLVTVTDPKVRVAHVGCPLAHLKHAVAKVNTTRLDAIKAREADAEDELAAHEVFDKLEQVKKNLGNEKFESARRQLLGEGVMSVGGTITGRITASQIDNWTSNAAEDATAENLRRKRAAFAEGLATYHKVDGTLASTHPDRD